MTSVVIGRRAEQAAADYLSRLGYSIVARNWRTRVCEIDLVAAKGKSLHFIEVKCRTSGLQGSGLDYITPSKLRQMRFAAEQWLLEHRWDGTVNLAAIEVCAPDYTVSQFIETIDSD